jgi:hypothetical protein
VRELLAHEAHGRPTFKADHVASRILRGAQKIGTRGFGTINAIFCRDIELSAFGVERGTKLGAEQGNEGDI